LLIGVGQTELVNYVSTPGISQSFPFLVIIAVMVFRGTALPVRGYFLQRLPAVGDGKVKVVHVAIGVVISLVLITQLPILWQDSMVTTFAMATILLSIVVVTGYAGQLSLGQYALAGLGAYIAGRAIDVWNFPFLLSIPFALIVIAPLGALFALPAVRARGLNLAIVTLGLGSAIQLIIFGNSAWTGGFIGTKIGKPNVFGLDISATRNPSRYAIFCMVGFILAALAVAAMRRGRSGRRLLAVRTNERAAAALGISVTGAKLYAFAVGAAIAGLGGILISFRKDTILFSSEFNNFVSVTSVGWAFLGGIGWLMGPIFGSTLTPAMQVKWVGSKIMGLFRKSDGAPASAAVQKMELPPETRDRVAPVTLKVEGLTVRYGGVTAVEDVTLQVPPGKITGLIGPNGAGKTSFIDAVTGFTRAAAGSITLDDADVTKLNAPKRARLGMSRSFQSLELFEDLSVLDNLRAASDPRDQKSYLTDLFWPVNPPLPGAVVAAINEFGLEDDLLRKVEDLSYGNRRLLAIARAVATQPNVLLLDEPAAGLGDAETAELASLVRRLADEWGMSILLVEHDMNFVMSVCDNIVVLDFGRKIAEGTPAEIQSNPLVVAAYLGGEHADH